MEQLLLQVQVQQVLVFLVVAEEQDVWFIQVIILFMELQLILDMMLKLMVAVADNHKILQKQHMVQVEV